MMSFETQCNQVGIFPDKFWNVLLPQSFYNAFWNAGVTELRANAFRNSSKGNHGGVAVGRSAARDLS